MNESIAVKEVSLGSLDLNATRARRSEYLEKALEAKKNGFIVIVSDKNKTPSSATQTALKKAEQEGLIVKPYRSHSCVVLSVAYMEKLKQDSNEMASFQKRLVEMATAEYKRHGFTVK